MSYSQNIWNQLKNKTADELKRALEKDGWKRDIKQGAVLVYRKTDENGNTLNRVTVHYHPNKTYGPKLLKGLIDDIGWSIEDLKRLKLIKGR